MVITAIQAILIAFGIGLIVGALIGWKFTFNMRLAQIQEQQVTINKLRDKLSEAQAEIRSHKIQKTKDNIGNAAIVVGQAAVATGGAVSNVASSLKDRLFGKKDVKSLKDENEQ
jgi:predicted negative regulator of RcsB-dependent stress response